MKSNEVLQGIIKEQKQDIEKLKEALEKSLNYIESFKEDLSANMAEIDIYALSQEKLTLLLDNCKKDKNNLTSELDSMLLFLFKKIEDIFEVSGKKTPAQLSTVINDSIRINQIETILDLYSEKIAKVRNDNALHEDEKEEKIELWRRLRDRDISRLEEL